MTVPVSPKRTALLALARERILVLDGAMGTMIQALQYDESAFRGERFTDFHRDLRGNNDLLILTQPKAIEHIHADYLRAGADIVATNTFSSTSIAQADYDLSGIAREMNFEGARLARAAAELLLGEAVALDHGAHGAVQHEDALLERVVECRDARGACRKGVVHLYLFSGICRAPAS